MEKRKDTLLLEGSIIADLSLFIGQIYA